MLWDMWHYTLPTTSLKGRPRWFQHLIPCLILGPWGSAPGSDFLRDFRCSGGVISGGKSAQFCALQPENRTRIDNNRVVFCQEPGDGAHAASSSRRVCRHHLPQGLMFRSTKSAQDYGRVSTPQLEGYLCSKDSLDACSECHSQKSSRMRNICTETCAGEWYVRISRQAWRQ